MLWCLINVCKKFFLFSGDICVYHFVISRGSHDNVFTPLVLSNSIFGRNDEIKLMLIVSTYAIN